MKVRITNNKIRYRLKQPEVECFKITGVVTETLAFGEDDTDQIHFSLASTNAESIRVSFSHNHTTIYVPAPLAAEWTTTDRVGFEAVIVNEKSKTITLLVEKDFACMDGRLEDNEDTYPNPKAMNGS